MMAMTYLTIANYRPDRRFEETPEVEVSNYV